MSDHMEELVNIHLSLEHDLSVQRTLKFTASYLRAHPDVVYRLVKEQAEGIYKAGVENVQDYTKVDVTYFTGDTNEEPQSLEANSLVDCVNSRMCCVNNTHHLHFTVEGSVSSPTSSKDTPSNTEDVGEEDSSSSAPGWWDMPGWMRGMAKGMAKDIAKGIGKGFAKGKGFGKGEGKCQWKAWKGGFGKGGFGKGAGKKGCGRFMGWNPEENANPMNFWMNKAMGCEGASEMLEHVVPRVAAMLLELNVNVLASEGVEVSDTTIACLSKLSSGQLLKEELISEGSKSFGHCLSEYLKMDACMQELVMDQVKGVIKEVKEEFHASKMQEGGGQQSQQSEPEEEEVIGEEVCGHVHVNIQCDGCDVYPVVGFRYKSMVQDNVDLCQKCFDNLLCGAQRGCYERMPELRTSSGKETVSVNTQCDFIKSHTQETQCGNQGVNTQETQCDNRAVNTQETQCDEILPSHQETQSDDLFRVTQETQTGLECDDLLPIHEAKRLRVESKDVQKSEEEARYRDYEPVKKYVDCIRKQLEGLSFESCVQTEEEEARYKDYESVGSFDFLDNEDVVTVISTLDAQTELSLDFCEDDVNVLVLNSGTSTPVHCVDGYTDETFESVSLLSHIIPNLACDVMGYNFVGCASVTPPSLDDFTEFQELLKGVVGPNKAQGCFMLGKVNDIGGVVEVLVRNSSDMPWPFDAKLKLVHGDGAGFKDSEAPCLDGGEMGKLTMTFPAGGNYIRNCWSFWIMTTGKHCFGSMLCVKRV